MAAGERVLADTNVLVSRFILPESISAQAIRRVELDSILLFSDATMMELAGSHTRRVASMYCAVSLSTPVVGSSSSSMEGALSNV